MGFLIVAVDAGEARDVDLVREERVDAIRLAAELRSERSEESGGKRVTPAYRIVDAQRVGSVKKAKNTRVIIADALQ